MQSLEASMIALRLRPLFITPNGRIPYKLVVAFGYEFVASLQVKLMILTVHIEKPVLLLLIYIVPVISRFACVFGSVW